ncbi:winged helix-turn-helix domain-containing protein [Amycolatopsis sp. H6(2020)]|nr:winged helix-turn-helix domain-containing protein [Amycolatopsis sp. H6(2020)]
MDFRLLGPVEIRAGGERVEPGTGKQRCVLAALLLDAGRPLTPETLIDRVWGEDPPAQVRSALYSYISRSRRLLTPTGATIRQRSGGYVLDVEPDRVDVHRFDSLADEGFTTGSPAARAALLDEALALWHGEPLTDVPGQWAETVRHRLTRRRVRVCAEWARCAVEGGDAARAIDRLEQELHRNPHAEPVAGQLMLAYHAQQRRAEAIACYAAFREQLADALGVEPGPSLQHLHLQLLRDEAPAPLPAGSGGPAAPVPAEGVPEPAVAATATAKPPYLGLATFEEADADRFFGRRALLDDVLARLENHRFLSVFGPSGSGKSSFLRAGLLASVPRAFPGWSTRLLTPGGHPLRALAVGHPVPELEIDPAAAARLVEPRTLVVVDQFEEVFTLCHDELERARFVEALICLAENPGVPARVVIGVRADFYPACAAHPALVALLRDQQFLVGPMTEPELRAAITEPAAAAGLTVEAELADAVVAEVAGEPAALPLFSHALRETWQRREGDRLTVAAYHATGGVRGAIAQTADALYGALDARQARIARDVFLRLTAPGEGSADTRRRPRYAELFADGDAGEVTAVLHRLAGARLVTLDEDTVTVAHEYLIRGWPKLRRWIDEDREFLRARARLTDHALEWEHHDRAEDLLYPGSRLALWTHHDRRRLNDLEAAFLDASRRRLSRQETQKRRRVRAWLAGLAAASAVLLVLTVVTVLQARQARRQTDLATAGRLVADARSQLALDPELALLLARQAYALDADGATEAMLAQALTSSRVRARFTGHTGPVTSVVFGPGGTHLADGGTDGTVRVETPGDGTSVALPGRGAPVTGLAYDTGGRRIAAAHEDGEITVWQDGVPRRPGTVPGGALAVAFAGDDVLAAGRDGSVWSAAGTRFPGTGAVRAAAFDAAAGKLASADDAGRVRVTDLRTGAATVVRGPGAAITRLAFDPAGTTLAGGREDGREEVWTLDRSRAPLVLYPNRDRIQALAFGHDGRVLASGARDRTTHLWQLTARRDFIALRGQSGPIRDVAFGPGDRTIATAGDDGTVRLWEPAPRPGLQVLDGQAGPVLDTAFDRDGARVAAASAGGTVVVHNLRGGAPVVLRGAGGPVEATAFSPDGRFVAGSGDDGSVRLWPATGGPPVSVHIGPGGPAWAVAFSADGEFVFAGHADGTIERWRRDGTGTPLVRRAPAAVRDLAALPDGRIAAAVEDATVRIWGDTGDPVVLPGVDGMRTVAVSADGRRVAGAGNDGVVRIWPSAGGAPVAVLQGHYGLVFGVAFSPDGQYVASVGNDKKVRIWNWPRWRDPVVFDDYNATVQSIAFGPGNRVAVGRGESNETVDVWRCEFCLPADRLGELADVARDRTTRELTTDERDRYPATPAE